MKRGDAQTIDQGQVKMKNRQTFEQLAQACEGMSDYAGNEETRERLIAAAAALRNQTALIEALRLFTNHSMGLSTMLGETYIGWQKSEGPKAYERVQIAKDTLTRCGL